MRFARKLLLALALVLMAVLVVAFVEQRLPHPNRSPYGAGALEFDRRQ